MISAETGSPIWKVIGRSIAMVAVAPMPGRTPIRVPSITPIRQNPRLASVEAVEKPRIRFCRKSIGAISEPGPGTETLVRQAKSVAEYGRGEDRDREGEDQRRQDLHARGSEGSNQRSQEQRGHKAQASHCQAKENWCRQYEECAAPGNRAKRFAVVAGRLDQHDKPE